jgi:DNA-binding NtrC family response regulator
VLLIDDEATIRSALRRFFARRGWQCDEAEDGESGLARLLADDDYSLVISDFRMPGLSGAELHDRLAQLRPQLLPRLVLSTGDTVSARVAEFIARTRCAVLEKPFSLGALAETAERIVGRA